jgi:hypothetical protein
MRAPSIPRWVGRLALVVLALDSEAAGRGRGGEEGVKLFTEQEATELRVGENGWEPVPRARSASEGPRIIVHTPAVKLVDGGETIETSSPTSMWLEFQENQAPVDMRSLQISAKKGPFRKSLMDLLEPFLEGTRLVVDKVEVPVGKFQIQILVQDREGHETTETYRLIVEAGPDPSR